MREDTFTSTEADARDYAALLGASEHIGGGPGNQDPGPWEPPRAPRPDLWGDPVPEEIPLGHCSEDDCTATYLDHLNGGIRAHEEGWFFMKDGRKYCPDHNPPWVAEWRARR